jgi:hypothetical protein
MAQIFHMDKKDFVERAVDEFISQHRDVVDKELAEARALLLSGDPHDELKYAAGMAGVDLGRVSAAYARRRAKRSVPAGRK